ncbi:MAG: hypothetical protein JSW05_10540 [Candidatus Thorarchaeota archaeon]|nr:MAG: hypothetical protein JSW05_10540 [Candidatus Thorarchaeota archaeon]
MTDKVIEETPRMCDHCGVKKPFRAWGYGRKKYCSVECHAADFWRYYILIAVFTGTILIFGVIALIRWAMEGSMPPIDILGWLQFTFWILTTVYFAYYAVIGYRKVKSEHRDTAVD